jgi:hypothetical protein
MLHLLRTVLALQEDLPAARLACMLHLLQLGHQALAALRAALPALAHAELLPLPLLLLRTAVHTYTQMEC